MRHGEAVPPLKADATRELTSLGVQECRQSANWILQQIGSDDAINMALVSPFLRAFQSLSTVTDVIPVGAQEESADLVPSGSVTLVADYIGYLESHKQFSNLLIVSHMPMVSYLLDELCQSAHSILFPTAAVAMLDKSQAHAEFKLLEVFHPT